MFIEFIVFLKEHSCANIVYIRHEAGPLYAKYRYALLNLRRVIDMIMKLIVTLHFYYLQTYFGESSATYIKYSLDNSGATVRSIL